MLDERSNKYRKRIGTFLTAIKEFDDFIVLYIGVIGMPSRHLIVRRVSRMSCFAELTQEQEEKAIRWQTTKIASHPQNIKRLASAMAVIQARFISSARWNSHVNNGSITFQNESDHSRVVSVFVDHDNQLAKKFRLDICENPIVVGIELTYQTLYVRYLVRQDLRQRYAQFYMDPEAGRDKYYLSPHPNHAFDILFVDDGFYNLERDAKLVNDLKTIIERHCFGSLVQCEPEGGNV